MLRVNSEDAVVAFLRLHGFKKASKISTKVYGNNLKNLLVTERTFYTTSGDWQTNWCVVQDRENVVKIPFLDTIKVVNNRP